MIGGRRAVFLDKDGTLIEDVGYGVDPGMIRLTRGAEQGLCDLYRAGYLLIVVSNQSGVARGYFAEEALAGVEQHLQRIFQRLGLRLAGMYCCPHHPEGVVAEYRLRCDCRKPAPGMLMRAADEHGIDLSRSWLIGDILDDVEAGRRAGCRTVLLNVGHETEWVLAPHRAPDLLAADLAEAARLIIAADDMGSAVAAGMEQTP